MYIRSGKKLDREIFEVLPLKSYATPVLVARRLAERQKQDPKTGLTLELPNLRGQDRHLAPGRITAYLEDEILTPQP